MNLEKKPQRHMPKRKTPKQVMLAGLGLGLKQARTRNSLAWVLAGCASITMAGCGNSKAAELARAVLCNDGLAKGLLTIGLNLGGLGLNASASAPGALSDTTNEGLKSFLNGALSAAGVPPDAVRVANVDSVKDGDSVRFLKLDGNYSPLFGVATGLFKQALSSQSSGSGDGGPLKFVYESFSVAATQISEETPPEKTLWNSNFLYNLSGFSAPVLATENTYSPQQWAMEQTQFAKAREIFSKGTQDVVVAVIDTGVDLEHPDLKDILVEGYNFVDNNNRPQDGNGHGTHCAGIIAAQAKSGANAPLGVAALPNKKIKIMPLKVLGDDGSGNSQNIDKAIRWAVDHGADVLSLSLGGGLEFADALKQGGLANEIIKEALAKKVIVVVAAGNEGCPLGGACSDAGGFFSRKINEYTVVPCAYEGTICVGATDPDETLAKYSNYSSKKMASYRTKVDVNAPGSKIYSTWPTAKGGPYKAISGTSMATPLVAGMAALMKANDKSVDQETVRKFLKKGEVFPEAIVQKSEAGRVDLYSTSVAFAREQLKDTTVAEPNPKPGPNPVPTPNLPKDEGGGLGNPLVGTLWDAVCKR